jgi:hypothetical protein
MPTYIAHRINTSEQLAQLPTEYGVEIDLRDFGERLVLQHDPFVGGEDFEEYLRNYRHGLMILNIKSERIEPRVLALLEKYNVREYFFLDSSFPMIFSLSSNGEQNIAVRFSELEPAEYALALAGRARWVWVDCFTKLPLDRRSAALMREAGFKLCLVSPDLVGRERDISAYKKQLQEQGVVMDAICCKAWNIAAWR